MNMARYTAPSAICLIIFAAMTVQTTAAGIDTVAAYAGTWDTHIVHYATADSKARTEHTHLRNDCWKSAAYFACDQIVDGSSKALVVFTYDPAHNVYHTYAVPNDGTPASSGELLISGDTWTFPWQETDNGKTTYGRVINIFHGTDMIEYRQEFSNDGTHWTVTATGTEHRISH